jgi:glyoxylase-like metal-dependent hydrolase (beta-lactamase superfamily II)
VCIYDEGRGYLVTGDTLYHGTLIANHESTDPLAFANSVQSLRGIIGIRLILPGHYTMPLAPTILAQADTLFERLRAHDVLRHGSGRHEHGDVAVLI